jgi:hypothetical protein
VLGWRCRKTTAEEGTDRSLSPDGSWSFEDARKRREQRQAAQTAPAPPTSGGPEEDLSALALSLADNLTIDGTPLSQLEIRQELDGSDPLGRSARDAQTAEEIMRALETEQYAAGTSDNGSLRTAQDPRPVHSPYRPSTRRTPHRRRLHPSPRWVIACSLLTVVVGLVVQLASGTGPNSRGHPRRTFASSATAPTSGLIEAAMNRFLAEEHAADRTFSPTRPRSTRASRPGRPHPRPAPVHISTSLAGPTSSSASTSSTTDASESAGTPEQVSQTSSSPSSSSTSSGSGQSPPATQPHAVPNSNSGSSSTSQSKATLRSLVTGAGTCGCQ